MGLFAGCTTNSTPAQQFLSHPHFIAHEPIIINTQSGNWKLLKFTVF